MNNEEILKKAIKKAVKNGYNGGFPLDLEFSEYLISETYLIFSHDFAKAFWGEERIHTDKYEYVGLAPDAKNIWSGVLLPAWKYHLQQMVLEENPITYLERFL